MAVRLVEGNYIPGNRISGDDLEPPLFCPVCGSGNLVSYGWTTVDGHYRYPSLACYGWKPGWLRAIYRGLSIVEPSGAHYQYKLPSQRIPAARSFDRQTGDRL